MNDSGGTRASKKREEIGRLREQRLSYAEIGRRLGLTKPTVAYHARRLGIPADDKCARRYDWKEIQRAYDSGLSARQCAKQFGFNMASWHQAMKRGDVVTRPRELPIETLLVADRPQTSRTHLKERLLKAGLKANRCEVCGLTEWQGKPLSMQLHHLNGDGADNRLENIALWCPNCHSKSDTYGGRNGHRRKRVKGRDGATPDDEAGK